MIITYILTVKVDTNVLSVPSYDDCGLTVVSRCVSCMAVIEETTQKQTTTFEVSSAEKTTETTTGGLLHRRRRRTTAMKTAATGAGSSWQEQEPRAGSRTHQCIVNAWDLPAAAHIRLAS